MKPKTVLEAYGLFIAAKEAEGCREDTVRNLKTRVGFLKQAHGPKLVSDLLPVHISEVIASRGPGRDATTKENDRRAMSSFFAWCMEPGQGYCASNPAKKTTRTHRTNGDEAEPVTLTLAESRKLIEVAQGYKAGVLVPYIALGLFAGIRPRELSRLTWDCIDLQEGTITIGAKLAKMRQRRIVEMARVTRKDAHGKEIRLSANLAEWLAPYALKKTPIKGRNWRKHFDAIKEAAGLVARQTARSEKKFAKLKKGKVVQARRYWKKLAPVKWAPDILRHTAISNHFAQFHAAVSQRYADPAVGRNLFFLRQPLPRAGGLSLPVRGDNSPWGHRCRFFGGGPLSGLRTWKEARLGGLA